MRKRWKVFGFTSSHLRFIGAFQSLKAFQVALSDLGHHFSIGYLSDYATETWNEVERAVATPELGTIFIVTANQMSRSKADYKRLKDVVYAQQKH